MLIVLKAVFGFISVCCKIVYRILKLLRIRILVLYLIVCGLIQLIFHAFDGKSVVFWLGAALCVVLTLISWGLYFRKKYGVKRVRRERKEQEEEQEQEPKEPSVSPPEPKVSKKQERAKYFNVAGKPDYVFAEYGDRYELYRKGEQGLTLVRTDYKNNERSST